MALAQILFESTLVNGQELMLTDLFRTSRSLNKKRGITGVILCSGCDIIGVFEGEAEAVKSRFAEVRTDPRLRVTHCKGQSIQQRHFSKWNSGYRNTSTGLPSNVASLYDAYCFDAFDLGIFQSDGSEVHQKLWDFSSRF